MILLSGDMLKCDIFKIRNQLHHMLAIRNQVLMTSFPITVNLTDNEIRIPKNLQELDMQVNCCFNPINTGFILCHVISAVKTNPGCERNMETLGGGDKNSYTITYCIRRSIKHQRLL